MYKQLKSCRLCKGAHLRPLFSLGSQCLTGVFPKDDSAEVPRGPLELVKCDDCDLVQLAHSFESTQLYGQNYGYRSGLNGSMVRHLNSKVQSILSMIDLKEGDLVIDIGSNDGTTLRAYPDRHLTLVGVDPTGLKFKSYYPSDVELIPEFFSSEVVEARLGKRKARVVTSFSMFYDLEDPTSFMEEVRKILAPDGIWVFEQSYLPSMLETNSYDTICHEHLEYYALKQIQLMAQKAGLKLIDVHLNDVNGGSFSVVAAHADSPLVANERGIQQLLEKEHKFGIFSMKTYTDFAKRVEAHKQAIREFFDWASAERRRVIGYGASTKGNVLLQYCNITGKELPCIAEVNEDKFGAFTPGSLIPIVSEAAARRMCPDIYFVLPWHFRNGILARERAFLENGGEIVFPLPDISFEPGKRSFPPAKNL